MRAIAVEVLLSAGSDRPMGAYDDFMNADPDAFADFLRQARGAAGFSTKSALRGLSRRLGVAITNKHAGRLPRPLLATGPGGYSVDPTAHAC